MSNFFKKSFELHTVLGIQFNKCSLKQTKIGVENSFLSKNCLAEIGEEINHVCNDTSLLDNLKFLAEKNPIIAQSFAASVIRNLPPSPDRTIRLTQLGEVSCI